MLSDIYSSSDRFKGQQQLIILLLTPKINIEIAQNGYACMQIALQSLDDPLAT